MTELSRVRIPRGSSRSRTCSGLYLFSVVMIYGSPYRLQVCVTCCRCDVFKLQAIVAIIYIQWDIQFTIVRYSNSCQLIDFCLSIPMDVELIYLPVNCPQRW